MPHGNPTSVFTKGQVVPLKQDGNLKASEK